MTTPTMNSADAYNAEIAANAVRFAAALLLGKGRFANAEADTLAEIAEKAAQLKADHPTSTRQPVITAIDAAGNKAIISGKPQCLAKPAAAPKGKAKKPAASPKTDAPARPAGKRAEVLANAENGILPSAPDFSAPTHKRFVKKLEAVVALAEAGDLKGLRGYEISVVSSSPRAIAKYRDLCITALEAKKRQAKSKPDPVEPAGVDIPAFLRQQ